MRPDSSADGVLLFLTGFALGAAVALLTAPQSGKRTRRRIQRQAEDAQSQIEDLGEELIEKGREVVERARSAAEQKISEVRP
jgi:gas vesicle protein